jgi:hypothetical protein
MPLTVESFINFFLWNFWGLYHIPQQTHAGYRAAEVMPVYSSCLPLAKSVFGSIWELTQLIAGDDAYFS